VTSPVRLRISSLGAVALLAAALSGVACHDRPPTIAGPDTVAPRLQFVFPTASDPRFGATFDRDSNGLMDLELTWNDSLGRVNPASLKIIARGGVPGAAPDTNLALGWRNVRLDSTGAAFEETVPLLLRSGLTTLVVSLADSAGNAVTDSVTVALPPASFHRVINLNHDSAWPQERATNFVLLPDGSKGAVPFAGGHVAIFDPDGIFPTRYIHGVPNLTFAARIGFDATSGLAYMGGGGHETNGISVVNLQTEQFDRSVDVGGGVVSVFVQGSRLYVGEACTTGRIIVLDKVTLTEVGRVEPNYPNTGSLCNNSVVRAFNSTGTIGWARTVNQGVMSFDAQSFAMLQHLDVRPPAGDSQFGEARDIKLLNDRWLYLAKLDYGLDEIDLTTGQLSQHYPGSGVPGGSILELSIAPDSTRLFVSDPPQGRVLSVPGLATIWTLAPRMGYQDGAIWHPDGKRVYVMAEYDMDVYIVRPQ